MEIKVLYGKEGADAATGVAVVVDVFRAAATAAYAFASGAESIMPVATATEAFTLREQHPEFVLMGEEMGIKIEGFDYGNSPHELSTVDLTGKVVVQRTTAGTQGLVRSVQADSIFFGGFPTFSATAEALKKLNPPLVSIVAMDGAGSEDDVYAQCLRTTLIGEVVDWGAVQKRLQEHLSAQRFFSPEKIHSPRSDFDCCTNVDAFPFAIQAVRQEGVLRLIKV